MERRQQHMLHKGQEHRGVAAALIQGDQVLGGQGRLLRALPGTVCLDVVTLLFAHVQRLFFRRQLIR